MRRALGATLWLAVSACRPTGGTPSGFTLLFFDHSPAAALAGRSWVPLPDSSRLVAFDPHWNPYPVADLPVAAVVLSWLVGLSMLGTSSVVALQGKTDLIFADIAALRPSIDNLFCRRLESRGKLQRLPVQALAEQHRPLFRQRAQEIVGRIREQLDAFVRELVGYLVERNAGVIEIVEHAPGFID